MVGTGEGTGVVGGSRGSADGRSVSRSIFAFLLDFNSFFIFSVHFVNVLIGEILSTNLYYKCPSC